MRLQLFIFIASALLIYFGLHTLLFFLLTKFFFPKNRSAQFGLGLVLLLLALSFITAFIWTQFSAHKFLHGFYYGTAIWLGTMVNLLLIFGAGLLVFIVLHGFFPGIERKTFGLFLLGLVVLYTSYGLYHAGQLKTKFLSIPFKNAPGEWKGKKIVQISDVHLGLMNGESLSRKIAALIGQQKVDFVFITGDLFDGIGDDLSKSIEPLNRVEAPIYYITGNHETYLGIDKAISAIRKNKDKIIAG